MALITEVSFLEDTVIFDEIQFTTVFSLESFDPMLRCTYLTKDFKKPIYHADLNIPKDIYDTWGLDNNIVINWAIETLGHTLV